MGNGGFRSVFNRVGTSQTPRVHERWQSIDLSKDTIFASAQKRAQQLARITKRFTAANAMNVAQYEKILNGSKDPVIRLFFTLAWAFAARIGDLRQVLGADIAFGEVREDRQLIVITFRAGKGAAFWGPFVIQTNIPIAAAKDLALRINTQGRTNPIFSTEEQHRLSKAVAEEGLDLRSIRRGRLQYLAELGVTNEQLRLLSGHRRMDTLLRYLGWGRYEADGRAAAHARDAREETAGTVEGGAGAPSFQDRSTPKMGLHSGYAGDHGRRVQKPPSALPHKPPKRKELGIEFDPVTTSTWILKAKMIDTLNWSTVAEALSASAPRAAAQTRQFMKDATLGNHLLTDEDWLRIDEKLATCTRWCSGDPMEESLGDRPDLKPEDIPFSKINRKDYDHLHAAKKLAKLSPTDRIRGWCSGYIIPQAAKQARRPVWETHFNDDKLPEPIATYTSRRVRRYLKDHSLTVDFDFTQWFDQFALTEEAQQWWVRYRVEEEDGSVSEELSKLTRLAMGATFAPATAQALTDAIIAPLLRLNGVKVFTMIDNVRLACSSEAVLIEAVYIFLARCEAAGVKINEPEWPTASGSVDNSKIHPSYKDFSREDWIELGHAEGKVFLGEQYSHDSVRNSPKNVAKFVEALDRLRTASQGSFRTIIFPFPTTSSALHCRSADVNTCRLTSSINCLKPRLAKKKRQRRRRKQNAKHNCSNQETC